MQKNLKKLPLVSIIVVNWNGREFLINCLKSVYRLNYPKAKIEVIVIDNSSSDRSLEEAKDKFPKIIIKKHSHNLGFAAAINTGLRTSSAKYSMVLSHDVILDKDSLAEMLKALLAEGDIAMVGPKLYSMEKPNELQCVWGEIDKNTMQVIRIGAGELDLGQYDEIKKVEFLPFTTLLRNKIVKKTGYYDTRYFHGFEEVDIMIRLKEKGFKLVYSPKAKIWHKGAVSMGADSPKTIYYLSRNNLIIREKFNGFSFLEHLKNFRFLFSLLIFSIVAAGNRKTEHIMAARGIFDFYRKRFGPAPF